MSERSSWPALVWEALPWKNDDSALMSRSARRRASGPYDAAVVPAIRKQTVVLPSATTALVEDAANALSRFDAELGQHIAPFATILLRSESAASSKIENLTASARAIAEAELMPSDKLNASMVVANQRAMTAAIALAENIDLDAILEMHRALLQQASPDMAGRWREEQVWIGGGNFGPHGATFVPPHHRRVLDGMKDLVAFIDRDDIPVLAHAAIAHAQLETIHPFSDGNGRTGRALVHAHLRNKRLLRNVTVPVSAGLLSDVDAYFAALTRYRAGDPVAIVEAFAQASFAAVSNGNALVNDLRDVRATWAQAIKVRKGATVWRIVDLLLRTPVVNAALVGKELGVAPQNVYRALTPLEAAGVIVESTDKKRGQLWRAPAVLEALDRFAVRSGKRRRG